MGFIMNGIIQSVLLYAWLSLDTIPKGQVSAVRVSWGLTWSKKALRSLDLHCGSTLPEIRDAPEPSGR